MLKENFKKAKNIRKINDSLETLEGDFDKIIIMINALVTKLDRLTNLLTDNDFMPNGARNKLENDITDLKAKLEAAKAELV